MDWFTFSLLGVATALGAALTVVSLPGLWLLVIGAAVARLLGVDSISWTGIAVAGGIGLLSELLEFLAGAVGAKAAGANKGAMTGALVGGIVGAIAGTFLIPVPIVGTLAGSAIGAGLSASAMQIHGDKSGFTRKAAMVGAGAAAGRLAAVITKVALTFGAGAALMVDAAMN